MLPPSIAWTVAVVTILSRSLLSTVVALLLWGVLPGVAGFPTSVVMSGSMAPQLQVGDAVVTRSVDGAHLAVGQVLLFDDPDHAARLRLHRLAAVDEQGRLWTRGDANSAADSSSIALPAVHGAGFLRIPFAGLPTYWIRTQQPLPLVASGLAVVLLVAGVRLGRLLEDPEERRRRHRAPRVRAARRAAAAGAVLVALGGAVAAPPPEAQAAYSSLTRPPASTWGTQCGDVPPSSPASGVQLHWGYGGTGTTVADLSGRADTGTTAGDAARVGCSAGAGPALSVGSGTGGGVIEQTQRSYPGDTTVATWFRTSVGGGVLADFGSSNTSAGSSGIDRVLYLRADGSVVFGNVATQAAGAVLSTLTCTSRSGLADGRWHLVVATWSLATGCTLTIDDATPTTATPAVALNVLSGFPGYWRFGYDVPGTLIWPGATPRFVGTLDESQVYAAVLGPAARTAIHARGH